MHKPNNKEKKNANPSAESPLRLVKSMCRREKVQKMEDDFKFIVTCENSFKNL